MSGLRTRRAVPWWLVIPAVGSVFFLYLRAADRAVGAMPRWSAAAGHWRAQVDFALPVSVDLLLALLLTVMVFLSHHVDKTPRLSRAIGMGLMMSIVPGAALMGTAGAAGLGEFGLIKALILTLGLVTASVMTFQLGIAREGARERRSAKLTPP